MYFILSCSQYFDADQVCLIVFVLHTELVIADMMQCCALIMTDSEYLGPNYKNILMIILEYANNLWYVVRQTYDKVKMS